MKNQAVCLLSSAFRSFQHGNGGIGQRFRGAGSKGRVLRLVLDQNEAVIPGLYAAGEVTGGFHGTKRVDGSGTGDAFVFGYVAGNAMAGEVLGK